MRREYAWPNLYLPPKLSREMQVSTTDIWELQPRHCTVVLFNTAHQPVRSRTKRRTIYRPILWKKGWYRRTEDSTLQIKWEVFQFLLQLRRQHVARHGRSHQSCDHGPSTDQTLSSQAERDTLIIQSTRPTDLAASFKRHLGDCTAPVKAAAYMCSTVRALTPLFGNGAGVHGN